MGDKDGFYQYVQAKAKELRGQIDALKTTRLDTTVRDAALTQCLMEKTNLTSEVRSHVHNTASHDQRIYNETLQELNDQLQKVRSEIAPRRKFTFKSAAKTTPTDPPLRAPDKAPVTNHSNQSTEEPLQASDPESTETSSTSTSFFFTNIYNTLCLVPSSNNAGGGVVLADSSCCVIKCPVPFRSLTIKDIRRSVIAAGPINGAAHVMRLADSILIVSCRQLRMHDCRNCDVYLQCGSNPIIEHCSEIRFAPLQGIPEGIQTNMWDKVNDFNWLKAGHSPNWSVLDLASRFKADQWNIIQSLNEGDPVKTVLNTLNVS
ncbi:MAG: hypothetical protein Q9171_000064 [Xanthocarpia ochracea]